MGNGVASDLAGILAGMDVSRCEYESGTGECRAPAVGSIRVRPNPVSGWQPFAYCAEHDRALVDDLTALGWDVDEAGCSCGWHGRAADAETHPCPLPDPT